MEAAKRTTDASAVKRRRTNSTSPRRSSRRISDSKNKNINKTARRNDLSATPTKNNRRRRSSMRRTSLVATLGRLQPDKDKTVENKENSNEEILGAGRKTTEAIAKPVVTIAAQGDKTDVSSSTGKVSPDSGVVSSYTEKESGGVLSRLEAEVNGWKAQLEKYKGLQDEECILPNSVLNLEESNSKYLFWHEQISDLEDRLSHALFTINKTMKYVSELKSVHMDRVRKLTEEVYNQSNQEEEDKDVRVLIRKIFTMRDAD